MNPPEIAFLALGLVLGGTFGAAFLVVARARPPLRPVVRVTITPNAIQPRAPGDRATGIGYRNLQPVPGSPDDDAGRDAPAIALAAANADAARAPRTRTRVPSDPVLIPSSSVAIRVEPGPRPPVPGRSTPAPGPAASLLATSFGGSTSPAGNDADASAPAATGDAGAARPATGAVAVAVADPVTAPAPMIDRVDVGTSRSDPAVQARASRPVGGTLLVDPVVGIPVHADADPIRPAAASRAPRHAAGAGATAGGTGAAAGGTGAAAGADAPGTDPCADPRATAVERCSEADSAREAARIAADALRDAHRAHAALEAQVEEAGAIADPRRLDAEKERLHADFKARHDLAAGPDDAEAAARDWLTAISELNDTAREATHRVQSGTAELRTLAAELAKLDLEADAARIGAESAEDACRAAREALARCEELEQAARATPAREEHGPEGGRWPGGAEPEFDREAAGPAESKVPVIVRVLRGDAVAREQLVAALAAGDATETAAWHVRIARFVDAVRARAIEAGALDLPDDNPFWSLFGGDERREIVGALSALGFRYDGLSGFADERVPTARDLSLAVGYAGLDPMRIRTWPREAELAALFDGAVVLADGWLAEQADDLALGRVVDALGARAAGLDDLWDAWGRVRPAMLADA